MLSFGNIAVTPQRKLPVLLNTEDFISCCKHKFKDNEYQCF